MNRTTCLPPIIIPYPITMKTIRKFASGSALSLLRIFAMVLMVYEELGLLSMLYMLLGPVSVMWYAFMALFSMAQSFLQCARSG